MNSKQYKSDVFLVAIQLLLVTAREIYMRIQVVCAKRLNVERLIYICGYCYVQTTGLLKVEDICRFSTFRRFEHTAYILI